MCSFHIATLIVTTRFARYLHCGATCAMFQFQFLASVACVCVCVCVTKRIRFYLKIFDKVSISAISSKKGSDTLHYLVYSKCTASRSLIRCISFRFPRANTLSIDLRLDPYTPSSVCLVLLSFPIITMKLKLIRTNLQIETDYTQSFISTFSYFVPFQISNGCLFGRYYVHHINFTRRINRVCVRERELID